MNLKGQKNTNSSTGQRRTPRRLVRGMALGATLAAVGAVAIAGGSSGTTAKAAGCSGAPVKVMAVGNLSSSLGQTASRLVSGVKAGATAITKTCQLGHPVQVIVCDDKFNPNAAAACARKAVSSKVVSLVSFSGFDDSINPILKSAGIPSYGNNGSSSTDSTSPISFPSEYSVTELLGELDIAASLGSKNIKIAALDIPAITFLTGLLEKQAAKLGTKTSVIPVSPTATDLTSIAGQVLSSKADGVINIMGPAQTQALLKSLSQQGANFRKLHVLNDLSSFDPAEVKQLGKKFAGVLSGGGVWSPTDRNYPAIKQYFAELKAAKQPTDVVKTDVNGVAGWATVHLIADALTKQPLTSKALIKRLNTAGAVVPTKYGLPPTTYGKPAFPGDPVLKTLRIYTKYDSAWQINSKGALVPLSKKWLDVTKKMSIKQAG